MNNAPILFKYYFKICICLWIYFFGVFPKTNIKNNKRKKLNENCLKNLAKKQINILIFKIEYLTKYFLFDHP